MSQHAALFRSVLLCCVCFVFCGKIFDFLFGSGGGGVQRREKLEGSMERLTEKFSINQRALQLITDLSYSIGDLSKLIKECSC